MKNRKNSLIKILSEIKDIRRDEGKRHSIEIVLLVVIFATMSGYNGYRAIGDFIKRNKKDLIMYLKPKKNRMFSYSTVRRVMIGIDFNDFTEKFYQWTKDYVEIKEGEWISIDGKAIKGTLENKQNEKQSFTNLVSVFCSKRKMVYNAGKIENSKESEIPKVKELIEMLDLEGVVFTMDALHCQKKLQKL